MCNPAMLTAFSLASSFASGAAALTAKPPKPPKPVAQPAPAPKPKAPTGGFSSTLLTGAGGLAPGSQNIGTSTLLGQ